jgi:hypothetical protein
MTRYKPASKTAERRAIELRLVEALIAQSKLDGTTLAIKNRYRGR